MYIVAPANLRLRYAMLHCTRYAALRCPAWPTEFLVRTACVVRDTLFTAVVLMPRGEARQDGLSALN